MAQCSLPVTIYSESERMLPLHFSQMVNQYSDHVEMLCQLMDWEHIWT